MENICDPASTGELFLNAVPMLASEAVYWRSMLAWIHSNIAAYSDFIIGAYIWREALIFSTPVTHPKTTQFGYICFFRGIWTSALLHVLVLCIIFDVKTWLLFTPLKYHKKFYLGILRLLWERRCVTVSDGDHFVILYFQHTVQPVFKQTYIRLFSP
jgi:hypothetical protein